MSNQAIASMGPRSGAEVDGSLGQSRALRIIGIQMAPERTREEAMQELGRLNEAGASGKLIATSLPSPRLPAQAIFADDTGSTYVLEPSATGELAAIPAMIGERDELDAGLPRAGRFIPIEAMQKLGETPRTPSAADAIAAVMAHKLMSSGTTDAPSSASAKSQKGNPILDKLRGIAVAQIEQAAARSLAAEIGGGSALDTLHWPTLSSIGTGLLNMGIGQALDFGAQAVLSSLFLTDDKSSQGQFISAEAAKELMAALKSEAADFIKNQLGLGQSPAGDGLMAQVNDVLGNVRRGLPLARTGDLTSHGGAVIAGTTHTVAGGVAVARATDQQKCAMTGHVGGPIRQGNPTVMFEGLPAAAYGHECICTGCGATATLLSAGLDVEIGSAVADVLPPPAPKCNAAASAATSGKSGSADQKSGSSHAGSGHGDDATGGSTDATAKRLPTQEELDALHADRAKYDDLNKQLEDLDHRSEWLDPDYYAKREAELEQERDALGDRIANNEGQFDLSKDPYYQDNELPSQTKQEKKDDLEHEREVGIDKDGPSAKESQDILAGKTEVDIAGHRAGEVEGKVTGSEKLDKDGAEFEVEGEGSYTNNLGDHIKGEGGISFKGDLKEGLEFSASAGGELGTHIGSVEIDMGGSVHTPDREESRIPQPGISVDGKGKVTIEVDVPMKIPIISGQIKIEFPMPDFIRRNLPAGFAGVD